MLNFHHIIPLAAQAAADKPIVAAPYALPEGICRDLASAGLIGGYIAESRPASDTVHPSIVGWWTDRSRGNWFIRPQSAKTMILLSGSPDSEVGARMLLEARLKGVQRILLVGENGAGKSTLMKIVTGAHQADQGQIFWKGRGVKIRTPHQAHKLGINIVAARDHEESYQLVAEGKADAFATDDVLLYGLIARHKMQRELIVVGEFLSYDPYGIMFRKNDPQLDDVVQRTFRRLAETRDIIEIYHKWFIRRTPTGEQLNLPMSAQLEEVFRVLGLAA